MKPLALYLRKEPTTDSATKECCRIGGAPFPGNYKDVVMYHDEACTNRAGRWPWHSQKPTKRNKWVMFNCNRYQAIWVQDEVLP